ncbi:hypothetical protein GDO81_025087 [Engystomops pustulosus]|uniref:Uncharacterized protein n=1 Tax=Engystomops pustulosus TaxID=76066 RepID=A0AAV6YIY2_ENGPU|nr:hypothetical protein GDO81_025087 [Engystomops pustulosus]
MGQTFIQYPQSMRTSQSITVAGQGVSKIWGDQRHLSHLLKIGNKWESSMKKYQLHFQNVFWLFRSITCSRSKTSPGPVY